jgi:hypothetical protein
MNQLVYIDRLRAFARLLPVLFGAAIDEAAWGADATQPDPNEAFAPRAAWAETMISTRANCVPWAGGAKEGELADTPLAAVWAKIRAAWPVQCAWFQQDLPGTRFYDWFLQSNNTHFERWIMGRVLARLAGTGAGLSRELDELVGAEVPPSDPRWLELYARARQLEEVLSASRRVWLGDLQSEFERQAADMIRWRVSSDDAQWADLRRRVGQCCVSGKAAHVGTITELRSAAEVLDAALPGRFSATKSLSQNMLGAGLPTPPKAPTLGAGLLTPPKAPTLGDGLLSPT